MYQYTKTGKQGITARIVSDSVSAYSGTRITTFELDYNRFVHSELMTHRLFSRNAMSSRAIPIEKMIDLILEDPALPVYWGMNQSGMQAKSELSLEDTEKALIIWKDALESAVEHAQALNALNVHKQLVNRILEPWQRIKVIVTATDFDNWWYLRRHPDAQPEIRELANCMWECYTNNTPQKLYKGEWHLPYIKTWRERNNKIIYAIRKEDNSFERITKEEAQKVSASCCAQVSYRVLDNSVNKAIRIYDKLIESKPSHASPVEHPATPMELFTSKSASPICYISKGTTHMTLGDGNYWSGNFKHWVQLRQLLDDHTCWDYKE